MQIPIILGMILKDTSDCFIINLHLPFRILNIISIYILVED